MSEIIWAMNAGFDTLESLIAYSRRFASEYLADHEIKLDFDVEGDIHMVTITGEKRRNIFLVIKEALHNAVKYAQAKQVKLHFENKESLHILIKDDGVGMEKEKDFELGNGIKNMKSRVKNLNGDIEFINDNGLAIKIVIPIHEKEASIT
jgi:signal transduction histidine kinase